MKPRLDAEMRIWGPWWGGCHLPDTVVGWGLCWALDAWVSIQPPSLGLTSLMFWDTHCVLEPGACRAGCQWRADSSLTSSSHSSPLPRAGHPFPLFHPGDF